MIKAEGAFGMGLWNKLYKNPREQEKIRPLLESRMMRDILMEIGQRGNEQLDAQSVPLEQRARAAKLAAAEGGAAELKQSVVDEVQLDEHGITLFVDGEPTAFLYGSYNYEDIEDTDCLPAVAQFLVQHLRGYYNISRNFMTVERGGGKPPAEKTRTVFIRRHHEDTPFDPGPLQKKKLF